MWTDICRIVEISLASYDVHVTDSSNDSHPYFIAEGN